MFVPGQLVAFIGAPPFKAVTPEGTRPADPVLVKGRVYTVAEACPVGWEPWPGFRCIVACLQVEEHPGIAFMASFFRPLSPRSISIVESLKAPVPGKVTEPA